MAVYTGLRVVAQVAVALSIAERKKSNAREEAKQDGQSHVCGAPKGKQTGVTGSLSCGFWSQCGYHSTSYWVKSRPLS